MIRDGPLYASASFSALRSWLVSAPMCNLCNIDVAIAHCDADPDPSSSVGLPAAANCATAPMGVALED